jgi:sterol desaturase/sphingolipid hydroxylase (fatty acid hydroxylase superfamily)
MLITLVTVLVGLAMLVVERLRPGRRWPELPGWLPRAFAISGVQALVVFAGGHLWDGAIAAHRLWSADALGTWGGALVGYVVQCFVYYAWHRARHEVPFLWRMLHQFHHSPQRLEVVTSFYKHPLEMVANSVLSSAVLYLVVGLGPTAAAGALLLSALAELFYHWNIRTPYWLGFIIQRPESHCVHHQHGVHAHNYADLPVIDMLFGTFRNPRRWEAECGLGAANEGRVVELLAGVDVAPTARGTAR